MSFDNRAFDAAHAERIRILYVEDDKATAVAVLRLLGTQRFSLVIALHAEEAIDLCKKCRFDLLLCDLQLPDGDGIDLIRRLVGHGCTTALVLSGHGTPEHLRQCQQMNIEHLLKPVEFEQLVEAITRSVRNGS